MRSVDAPSGTSHRRPRPAAAGRPSTTIRAGPARRWPTTSSPRSSTRSRRYADAFSGPMGETIGNAVQIALGGFLSLAGGRARHRPAHPDRAGGRGRLPARPRRGPQRPHHRRAAGGVPDRRPGLLAARCRRSAVERRAGRRDAGRLRRAGLRLHRRALGGERRRAHRRAGHHRPGAAAAAGEAGASTCSPARRPRTVVAAAERADWEPPTTLTAVIVPESQVRPVLAALSPHTLQAVDPPELDEAVLLLVPDAHGHRRAALLRTSTSGTPWPARPRPWLRRPRLLRPGAAGARSLGLPGDTEPHLARAGARAPTPTPWPTCATQVLAPLADAAARRPPRSWPRPCAPGCCTRAGATTSPRRSSCTRRPSATAWASCASSSATASTTPRRCSASRWRSRRRPKGATSEHLRVSASTVVPMSLGGRRLGARRLLTAVALLGLVAVAGCQSQAAEPREGDAQPTASTSEEAHHGRRPVRLRGDGRLLHRRAGRAAHRLGRRVPAVRPQLPHADRRTPGHPADQHRVPVPTPRAASTSTWSTSAAPAPPPCTCGASATPAAACSTRRSTTRCPPRPTW